MTINWPIITFLFCISIPGTVIALKRLIYFLLPNNTDEVKNRISRFAIFQTLLMVLVLSFAGTVLSQITRLNDPILEALLQSRGGFSLLIPVLLPTVLYACAGLITFCILYYAVIGPLLDKKSLQIMTQIHLSLGIDGCVLYGGVVEEIIARWGLMNLAAFFALLFSKQNSNLIIWTSIIISGLIFAVGQIPAYLAAGCISSRRFIYSLVALSLSQSLPFGYLFWQYGLISAIFAHMLFHLGWFTYENVKKS